MAKGVKTGGRKKGVPNKQTTAVKEMVLAALNRAGGTDYLEQQAKLNPTAFMTLIGKIIPHEVTGANGAPLTVMFQAVDASVL
jgi:hypothetical protein